MKEFWVAVSSILTTILSALPNELLRQFANITIPCHSHPTIVGSNPVPLISGLGICTSLSMSQTSVVSYNNPNL